MADVFDTGSLDVGDGHTLHYEQVGNPAGTPVVYLHGGPGSGATAGIRRSFDPVLHRGVVFDQRAAGRSRPSALDPGLDWSTINLDAHVADIERLRRHLGIDRWLVFGISWGSVLGMAYAERHPAAVRGVVLAAVSTGTRRDHDWLTVDAGRFYPAQWQRFRDHVPARLRDRRLVEAYNDLVMDPDPAVHAPAADAWCRWEEAHVGQGGEGWSNPRYEDPGFRLAFARQVTHCWRHDSWLGPDEIVAGTGRLTGIPGVLISGLLDLSGPIDCAWRITQAWSGSRLVPVAGEGHGGPTMGDEWRRALVELA